MIDVLRFRTEVDRINSHLSRFYTSSLEPLLIELGAQPMLNADPGKMTRLQELIFQIPYDKQMKYGVALDLLKPYGLYICGRPCDPTLTFAWFARDSFSYVGMDPMGNQLMVPLEQPSLHHVFDCKWKSTTGNLHSLANVGTREYVRFLTSQQAPPFTDRMPIDPPGRAFYAGESPTSVLGFGRDDHSIRPPQIVCLYPWVAGENVAEQWYQYTLDNRTWINIPGAAYLITKGVRMSAST